MKRTILVVLIAVMIATPCFAQEIEPDGLFSLDGTLWKFFRPEIQFGTTYGQPYFYIGVNSGEVGFYQGSVYWCSENGCKSVRWTYINTPVIGNAI